MQHRRDSITDMIRFDNFHIDVLAEGRAALAMAVQLAMFGTRAITHWMIIRGREERVRGDVPEWQDREDGYLTLVLLWGSASGKATPFPIPLAGDTLVSFVADWLASLKDPDKPKGMDHDGDNADGFRIFTSGWSEVYGISTSVFGVQAAWAAYGK